MPRLSFIQESDIMKRQPRTRLSLENLGSRWVPASATFSSGVLTITNSSLTPASGAVTITQTASNTFTLTGGASGTFKGVTLINYSGSNGVDNVTLNLGAFTYGGAAIFNTNGGNDIVTVNGGAGTAMQGNLTALTGLGNDTVNLANTAPLTVQGIVQVSDTYGTNTLNIATSDLAAGSDVTVTGFATVTQGAGKIDVARDLSINSSTTSTVNTISLAGGAVTVGRNMTVQTATGDDTILLGTNTAGGAIQVNGRLSVYSGAGNDLMNIAGGRGGFVLLTVDSGAGNDTVNLFGVENATWQVNLNLGDGDDTLNLVDGLATESLITGTVRGGAGTNVKTQGATWQQISPYYEDGF